jgi:hypothetical protein
MIVKDSRSPRGRYEESYLMQSIILLKTIGNIMPEDGMTWRERSELEKRRRPAGLGGPRAPLPRVLVECQWPTCPNEFLTAHPTYARYCGSTCKMRAHRAKVRAA